MDSAMTNVRVAAYCAASVAFDKQHNVYDGFQPLVKAAIAELSKDVDQQTILFNDLRAKINELFPVSINSAMLNRLLLSLKNNGTIAGYKSRNSITVIRPREIADGIDSDNYDLQHFFAGFCDYLKQYGKQIDLEKMQNDVCNLVFSRSTDLADFLSNSRSRDDLLQEKGSNFLIHFLDYILICEQESPADALAFKRLYNGAIQASLLGFSPTKVDEIVGICISTVILDTNFIVRLLGLQTPIENDLAMELWETLNGIGVKFVVLQSSIDEIRKSIKRFIAAYEPYQAGTLILRNHQIRSCGYLSAMQCGLTSLSQLQEYTQTANIKNALQNKWNCTFFDDDYSVAEEEISDLITAIDREGYGKDSAVHDLALIRHCISLRKEQQTFRNSAGNSKIWVLTEDNRLCKFSHQNAIEVQECISETQMSNLLWISKQKDSNNGLVSVMVALATKEMVTVEKYNCFISKINEYSQNHNDDSVIDCIAMVIADDMLTTQDINSVSDGSIEVDSLIFEKSVSMRRARSIERENLEKKIRVAEENYASVKQKEAEAQRHSTELQLKLEESGKKADSLTEKNNAIVKKSQREIARRNTQDIDRISRKLDELDKKKGRLASSIVIGAYLAVLVGIPIVAWKLGIWGALQSLKNVLSNHSKAWEILISILPAVLGSLWLLFSICVPCIYSLYKGRGFNIKPQFMWQLVKNDLLYKDISAELSGYEWLYSRIGNNTGLKELYDESDAGIDNVRRFIKDVRTELYKETQVLTASPVEC